jgi:hypothetical protein
MRAILPKMIFFFFSALTAGCSLPRVKSDARPITHEALTAVLADYVSTDGRVNYSGLQADSLRLNAYLDVIERHHPNASWTSNQKKAYWINAYNAFTLRLIIRNYPTASIKDLAGSLYKINTPWDIRFIVIEGQDYDLNNIEHDILRKEWQDARIHFAVNCASVSCPILLNAAYEAETLDAQLDAAAHRFINDSSRNTLNAENPELSRIFKWFSGDFQRDGNLIDFINRYAEMKINSSADVSFKTYDWNLNE